MKKIHPLLSIFLIVLVDVLGLTIILPLLPFYTEKMGGTPVTVGWLISAYSICQLIAGPILGQLSDRVGRKPVLLVSQTGTFLGFILLALAPNLKLIFLARIIDGITAGNLSVAQAYISDVTEAKNRAKSFGLIGIAFGLGFLLGPAISGLLVQYGYSYPIFAAAALSAISIAATFFLLPSRPDVAPAKLEENKDQGPMVLQAFKNPDLAPLLWQFFAFIFSFAVFVSGFALFAERRFTYHDMPFGAKEVGYVFAYVGLIGVMIQAGMMGKLVSIFGEKNLVRIGFASMFISFLLLGVVKTIPFLLMTVTLSFFGSSVLRPSLTSLITQKVSKARQGMVLGVTQSLMSISQIIAPVIGGFLIQHRFLSPWAWTGAASTGIGLLLVNFKNEKPAAAAGGV